MSSDLHEKPPAPPMQGTRSRRGLWAIILLVVLGGTYWAVHGHGLKGKIKHMLGWEKKEKIWTDYGPQWQDKGRWDPRIHFDHIVLAAADGVQYTAVKIGPDERLYAAADDGRIFRFPIRDNGTLEQPTIIDTIPKAEGKNRLLIGLCFDPAATSENPLLWVTHSFGAVHGAEDWSGKVSRLRGKDLEIDEDVVVHLPRSFNDHSTNQPEFGPDGALYIPQGSNTACGGKDDFWGNRPERLLNATILRLDTKKVTPGQPLDAQTADGGGSYDPYTRGAPLTIYATGLRNAYSLVWASNGQLYVPVNGAGVNGITPAGDGVPSLDIAESEHDWLFRITPGKYYGHPNPQQNHFIMNGGHPDDRNLSYYVKEYPLGTKPDIDYEPPIHDFGTHCSADGIIQYKGNAFHGDLDGALMVCRYNAGQDILCVKLDGEGNVAETISGEGLIDLETPLALCEDVRNGNLYVTEYGGKHMVLLKPGVPTPAASSRPATQPSSDEGSRKSNPVERPPGD